MGEPEEVAFSINIGLSLEDKASEIQDTFIPRISELQDACQKYLLQDACQKYHDMHGAVKDLEVQVRLAPSEKMPELQIENPPFLHLQARFTDSGSVEYIKAVETDAWQKSREKDLRDAFDEYKQNMALEDFEALSDIGDCLPEHLKGELEACYGLGADEEEEL